jgi:prepilin-type processing-associated H-X9-DG protein
MKYIGGSKTDNLNYYYDIDVYDCPSYPEKEQTIDYIVNGFNFKNPGTELHDATRLEDFPRPAQTIYLADYEYIPEASQITIVRKEDVKNPDDFRRKLWWLDAWNETHLPSAPESSRRVARDRHGRGTNCVFIDGHSAKMNSMEMTPYDWGMSFNDATP